MKPRASGPMNEIRQRDLHESSRESEESSRPNRTFAGTFQFRERVAVHAFKESHVETKYNAYRALNVDVNAKCGST